MTKFVCVDCAAVISEIMPLSRPTTLVSVCDPCRALNAEDTKRILDAAAAQGVFPRGR